MSDCFVVRRWVRLVCAAAICTLPLVVSGQVRLRRDPVVSRPVDQTGEFVFTRIRYGGYRSTWNHDYPRADLNLPRIIGDVTTIGVRLGESNVFRLDDPELFKHPIAYISEPGFWNMSESEVQGLRNYWLKGGFVIFDDFEARQWDNFALQVRRALPDHQLIEIDVTRPIFQVFFQIKRLDFPHPLVRVEPSYWGIFEDNDPAKRMMAIVNYNNDVAEYWEWSACYEQVVKALGAVGPSNRGTDTGSGSVEPAHRASSGLIPEERRVPGGRTSSCLRREGLRTTVGMASSPVGAGASGFYAALDSSLHTWSASNAVRFLTTANA